MKTLVAGWFSFEQGHATAGDLLALGVVCEWLGRVSYDYDIAFDPPFDGGVNWRTVDPKDYSHVVFVCGPFEQGELEAEFLSRFSDCRLIGLDLSMLIPLDVWNPFDLLFERDSSTNVRPDIAFLSRRSHVPIVGVCLVETYPGAMDQVANEAIERLIASKEMAVVAIDTRLDHNATGLRNPAEVESLLARMDVVVTTRLHGTVLALKNGIPVVPIDPMAGGHKIRRQVERIGWPIILTADTVTDETLQAAFSYCLTEAARIKAKECCERAVKMVEETRDQFVAALAHSDELERAYLARVAAPRDSDWILEKLGHNQHSSGLEGQTFMGKLIETGKGLLKTIAWWTLPTPIHNWLSVQRKGEVSR